MKKLLPAIALSLVVSVGLVPGLAFSATGESPTLAAFSGTPTALVAQASYRCDS